jgi:hypothetical protein
MIIPTVKEFINGFTEFQKREDSHAMYNMATSLVKELWNNPSEMAASMGMVLLGWNESFYKDGFFDFHEFEICIEKDWQQLNSFKARNIRSYILKDDAGITNMFEDFMDALKSVEEKKAASYSPVVVSRALHVFAPQFFPMWDAKIAKAYHCNYTNKPAEKYLSFIMQCQTLAEELQSKINLKSQGKSFLKLLDEFNYAKFTKEWV